MLTAAALITVILIALIAIQAALALGFIRRLKSPEFEPRPGAEYPKTAVIICVRGKDPTLARCLDAALNQDYPDYGVHVIVDSASDPAWPLVKDRLAANPRTPSSMRILADPRTSCSLKCSSLIQAISALDDEVKVVALLDTDVVPHRRWLKAMVAPLADPAVGATTGNRWFVPDPASKASLVRYAWNAAAVVMMHRLEIAWGGSLAIKRAVIDDGRLLSHWSRTYGDDTAINPALRRLGLRLELVPSALITERSACRMPQLCDWVTRQLLSCRLHHHQWKAVLAHGIVTSGSLASAAAMLPAALVTGYGSAASLAGAALAGYVLLLVALLIGLESAVRDVSVGRDQAETTDRPAPRLRLTWAVAGAQLLYPYALWRAATARTVVWRHARYEILAQHRIRRIEEHPVPTGARSVVASVLGGPFRRH